MYLSRSGGGHKINLPGTALLLLDRILITLPCCLFPLSAVSFSCSSVTFKWLNAVCFFPGTGARESGGAGAGQGCRGREGFASRQSTSVEDACGFGRGVAQRWARGGSGRGAERAGARGHGYGWREAPLPLGQAGPLRPGSVPAPRRVSRGGCGTVCRGDASLTAHGTVSAGTVSAATTGCLCRMEADGDLCRSVAVVGSGVLLLFAAYLAGCGHKY